MTASDPKLPEHEAIYKKIRNMILFGTVLPGQPVTILGLKEAVGAGVTPVREAIRRLTAEGALEALGNRRICVPELSAKRIDEIYFARFAIEPKMAELAATRRRPTRILPRWRRLTARSTRPSRPAISRPISKAISAFTSRFTTWPARRSCARSRPRSGCSSAPRTGSSAAASAPPTCPTCIPKPSRRCAAATAATARAIEGDLQQGLDLMRQALGV